MKNILNAFVLCLLLLLVSCADKYQEGFDKGKQEGYATGYEEGYEEGYVLGDTEGFERAKIYFETAGYNEGFSDGKIVGINQGYAQGYAVGKNETYQPNYNIGYNNGYDSGYDNGYDDGYDDGDDDAYHDSYWAGYNSGYDDGVDDYYDSGYDSGFGDGYDAGYSDGYGLSLGQSKKLQGYANLLSMAHNDIFDYSKIASPRQTKKGLIVNGTLLLSETSLTNKDTLKRAAVVEQYYVVEMSKQVKAKFGLSTERSLKIAKASNHFRKYASERALTAEDTNAYTSEIIGVDLKAIEKAYEQSLQGNVSAFNSVLDKAALKNETSPEKIAMILTTFFM